VPEIRSVLLFVAIGRESRIGGSNLVCDGATVGAEPRRVSTNKLNPTSIFTPKRPRKMTIPTLPAIAIINRLRCLRSSSLLLRVDIIVSILLPLEPLVRIELTSTVYDTAALPLS
jgi:hypothetical protein